MDDDLRPVLVIGATGFLGRRVVAALVNDGRRVRAMARTPQRAQDLAGASVEIVEGDFLDAASTAAAVDGVAAVVVCVHTISQQPAGGDDRDYMDVEAAGIGNVIAACAAHDVHRVLYVTSIGVAADAASSWLRGRFRTEKALLSSGLQATVLRPGMIVGRGGDGFGIVARGATRRFAVAVGSPRQRFRTVAVDDLARDLVDLLGEPAAVGRTFEAGSEDVLTIRQMTAEGARSVGRRPGRTVFVPTFAVRLLAPLVERLARLPRGAISGFVGEGPQQDMVGDPTALRAVLGRIDRPFAEAVAGQIG
ncbi:MAG: NAD(P)H-binding protein [Pseudonocardia sp.]|nr:NAD(P)H-binding protein [Pseudonocardia sp.]